jgi:eukaryotic-like serine/threonine-protein kinase
MGAAISDPLIGSIIANRYEVVRKMAKGGMGTIYEVRNTRLGRTFALKTITAEAAQDPEILARFRREADVVANLSHPNIVEVVDWDQLDDGAPFLVMEYLRGESLANRIAAVGPLPWAQIARIADETLGALGVAHRAGVVHRDLKPDNIFLATDDAGEERVKLLDFGISKIRDSQTFQTTDAKVLGTPAYMAPEQAEGRHDAIGPATDVWAMGAILHEMVTGAVAFAAPSAPAMLYRVCHGRPDPATDLRPDAPPELVEILEWALDLNLRLDDVEELRAELRRVLGALEGVSLAAPMKSRTLESMPRLSTPFPAMRAQTSPVRAQTPRPTPPRLSTPAPTITGATVSDSTSDLPVYELTPVGIGDKTTITHPAPRSKLPLILGGIGVFVVSAIVVFAVTRKGDDAQAPPIEPPRPEAIQPAIPIPPAPPPQQPPPAPAQVELAIESTPTGADVYRMPSEVKVGVTPWSEKLDKSNGTAVFIVRAAGRVSEKVEIDLQTGGTKTVTLRPVASGQVKRYTPPPKDPKKRRKGDPINPFEKP